MARSVLFSAEVRWPNLFIGLGLLSKAREEISSLLFLHYSLVFLLLSLLGLGL